MSNAATYSPEATTWHWLRNPRFDLTFVVGTAALGVLTGLVVTFFPRLFWPILVLDLWFLGYHHVISTYTRLCFDRKTFKDSWILIVGLMPAVAVITVAAAYVLGIWVIVSIYFYWQWFHYARQSWGISRAYRGKDRAAMYEDGWIDKAIFYALPVLGIVHRSHQDPGTFIGLDLKVIPTPDGLVPWVAAGTLLLLGYWLFRRICAYQMNRLSAVHTLYMLTHFTVFAVAYLFIEDVTYGWLAINIWHNAQYILFVWMFNTRRFQNGLDPEARLLSYISQPQRMAVYMLVCIAITGVLYWGVIGTFNALFVAGLSATIVLYQIVNFHHYIVDAMIWKVRKPPIRQTLGLTD